jgi:hypothetical protein
MNLQSNQPTTAPLGRSQSERGRGAETRDARLDKERQEREQLKAEGAVDTSDGNLLMRVGATSTAKGLGKGEGLKTNSPNPYPKLVHLEVYSILKGGIDSLALNDYGRPWPDPRRNRLAAIVRGHERDLCLSAAREAREIAQAQDRAPNITALFEKKLSERGEARRRISESLGVVR